MSYSLQTIQNIKAQHGYRVEFTKGEYEAIQKHVAYLDAKFDRCGVERDLVKKPGYSGRVWDLAGIKGEWAAAKCLGLPYRFRRDVSGDGGFDNRLPDGGTVSVRYGTKRGYNFGLYDKESLGCDYAVLVWPWSNEDREPRAVDVWGWLSGKHFERYKQRIKFGAMGESWGVRYWDFAPIDLLMRIVELDREAGDVHGD